MASHPDYDWGEVPRKADIHTYRSAYIGIKFNGQEIKNCIAYNVDEGWVQRSVPDAKGKMKQERGKLVAFTFKGKVVPFWKYPNDRT